MKTIDGEYVICIFTGKVCYTEREAGIVINGCKKHAYNGHGYTVKASYGNSKDIPRRKYYCKDCGYYHVTHKPLYSFKSRACLWEDDFYREIERKNKTRQEA